MPPASYASDKPTIVLVHPAGLCGEDMAPLANALREERCVRLYSRLGSNDEAPPARSAYYDAQGQQLVHVLRAGSTPAELFGWSSGGLVALHAALQAPQLVKRLYLYETPFLSSRDNSWRQVRQFLVMLAYARLGRGMRSRMAFWRMVSARKRGSTAFDRLPAETRAWLTRRPGALLDEIHAGTGEELRDRLAQIKVPVSILTGTASGQSVHIAANRLSEAMPSTNRQEIFNADHLTPLTMPRAIAESILRTPDRS